MNDNPLLLVLMIAGAGYMAHLWRQDYLAAQTGQPNPSALPGATRAPISALVIAALGGFIIVGLETWGELALGISGEQSNMTVLFAINTLAAAFIEELIFRGFIVVDNRGNAIKWIAAFAASLIFAALHPFLWEWEDGVLTWQFTTKAWFSTGAIFVGSLWFYIVRFAAFNPQKSLLPCVAAHAAKNIGVIAVKAFQGHLVGWW